MRPIPRRSTRPRRRRGGRPTQRWSRGRARALRPRLRGRKPLARRETRTRTASSRRCRTRPPRRKSLAEDLSESARRSSTSTIAPPFDLAEYLIDSLDTRGYLVETLDEVLAGGDGVAEATTRRARGWSSIDLRRVIHPALGARRPARVPAAPARRAAGSSAPLVRTPRPGSPRGHHDQPPAAHREGDGPLPIEEVKDAIDDDARARPVRRSRSSPSRASPRSSSPTWSSRRSTASTRCA